MNKYVLLLTYLFNFRIKISGISIFLRRGSHRLQLLLYRAWLNWSQMKCKVRMQHQIQPRMLSLRAHYASSSSRRIKAVQWVKNTRQLRFDWLEVQCRIHVSHVKSIKIFTILGMWRVFLVLGQWREPFGCNIWVVECSHSLVFDYSQACKHLGRFGILSWWSSIA